MVLPRHLLNVIRPPPPPTPSQSAYLYLMSCSPDSERYVEPDQHHQLPRRQSQNEWLGVGLQHPELGAVESPPPEASSHHICHYTPKCFLTVHRGERDVQLMPHLFSLHPTPTAPPKSKLSPAQEDTARRPGPLPHEGPGPLRHGLERRAGMKAPQRQQSELRMRWRRTGRPTTTRWVTTLELQTLHCA